MSTVKKLSSSIIFKGASNVISMLLALCISVLLNRHYGKDIFGLLVLTYSVTNFLFLFSDFGSKQTLNRFLPFYLKKNQSQDAHDLIAWSVLLQLAGIVIFSCFLFFSAESIAQVFFRRRELAPLLKVGILFFAGYSTMDFIFQVLQALQIWMKESILNIIYLAGYLALIGLVLFVFHGGLAWILVANFIAAFFVSALAIWFFSSKQGADFKISQLISLPPKEFRTITNFGLPMLLNNVAFFILMWLDKALLGRYVSIEQVTFYYLAFSFYSGVMILIKTLYAVLMPYLAGITNTAALAVRAKFIQVFRFFAHISIILAIIGFIAIDPIIHILYGASYEPVISVFRIFTFIIILSAIRNPIGMFIVNVFSLPKKNVILNIVITLVVAVLNFLLIPHYGYKGALVANSAGQLAWIVATFVLISQFKIIFPFGSLLKSISGFFIAISFYSIILAHYLRFNFSWILNILLTLSVYLLFNFAFKEIGAEDIARVKELVRSLRPVKEK